MAAPGQAHSSHVEEANYTLCGPFSSYGRNPNVNRQTELDARAAYHSAIMWDITDNPAYATKAKQILNGYSGTLARGLLHAVRQPPGLGINLLLWCGVDHVSQSKSGSRKAL